MTSVLHPGVTRRGVARWSPFLLLLFAASGLAKSEPDQEMIALAERSFCFNCHDIQETIRGPAWKDVAERYRGNADIAAVLVERIRNGSSGEWGEDSMSANRRVTEENVRRLVDWILMLE